MHKIKLALVGGITSILFCSCALKAVDINQVEKDLTTSGVQGWVHGAVHDRGLYVFTYRNPKNFFDYIEMSLVSFDPTIQAQLASIDRHDKILVKGVFLQNPSPQKHISVSSITIVEKYQTKYPSDPYQHEAKIPDDLKHINSALFLVHAIGGDGHILVVEYKDQVLPIFVQNASLAKNLYRGDVVELKFVIQEYPGRPTHLNVDELSPNPLKVIESVKSLHGKHATVEGALIMFPKSPEIIFNVFAVQQELHGDLKRQFTLVNFDNPGEFAKIRQALQTAWDKHPGQFVNGRNKLVSTKVLVKVDGTFNEVDPSQANPQILLKSVDSIKIEDRF